MSSQPANTQISVFRTIRSRIDLGLFASIKERTQRLGTAYVMVPGQEIDQYLVLDGSGTNAPGPNPSWRFGCPVTVNTRVRSTVAEMHTAMAADADAGALDFDKQLVGTKQDRFLQNTPAAVASDIQGDVARNAPPPRGLVEVV